MATHSTVLAWRIPGMEEPGGLPSMGSRRVRHDWSNLAAAAAAVLWGVRAKCSRNGKSRCRGPEAGGWHVWWRIEALVTGVQWDGLERKAGAIPGFDMGLGIPIWSRVQWKMERHWCGVGGGEAGSWSGVPHKSPEALGKEGATGCNKSSRGGGGPVPQGLKHPEASWSMYQPSWRESTLPDFSCHWR